MRNHTPLLDLIPPGEILREEFMRPLGLTITRLAQDLQVPVKTLSAILHAKRRLTADLALRLGKYFSVSPDLWLGLQMDYDLRLAQRTVWPSVEPRVPVYAEVTPVV